MGPPMNAVHGIPDSAADKAHLRKHMPFLSLCSGQFLREGAVFFVISNDILIFLKYNTSIFTSFDNGLLLCSIQL